MKWYIDKLDEIKNNAPIISVCGDDCAVCPRYLARTEDELHEVAVFWHKIGWRDRVVGNDEIKCTGCGCRPSCSFMVLPCQKEKGVSDCRQCGEFQCDRIDKMLTGSDEKEKELHAVCESAEEEQMLKRAFYEKRKNLGLK